MEAFRHAEVHSMGLSGSLTYFWMNISVLLLGYTKRDNEEALSQGRKDLACGEGRAGLSLGGERGVWRAREGSPSEVCVWRPCPQPSSSS